MQLRHHLLACSRRGARLTPPIASTFVGTDAREGCYRWLNLPPIQRSATKSRLQNDRGFAGVAPTHTGEMQPMASHIDQPARWRIGRRIQSTGNPLIEQSYPCQQDQNERE